MYTKELYHAGHKYIAKVKINGETRYFYDQDSYDAYLKVKKQEDAKKQEAEKSQKYQKMRYDYAKRTGDYTSGQKKLQGKTYAQIQREKFESGQPVKARVAKQIMTTNKINATKKAIVDNTREWRQKSAKKGKAFIDSILQPDR